MINIVSLSISGSLITLNLQRHVIVFGNFCVSHSILWPTRSVDFIIKVFQVRVIVCMSVGCPLLKPIN